ncbi:MBL fold metallo-hydrolase [Corynebacterium kalidii]|uniref:MBL fold metallo-hydrolase n=1 Tax=Corynebacterium kalidii TaxID=2931982 RepID=A0A9X1WI66_9CORY|nr:MBL fold metallo-hydrolase [Corynebacterium kalidii]MCJ7858918.1 MBL fold metallo-hydrolase [Corynebacterium kalidii]
MEHPAYSQLRPVTPSTGVVLCDNPSYQALEGTNSWIIRAPGDTASVIVDPGPQDEGHLNVLWRKASEGGAEVALILLTHHHPDHADGAARLRQLVGAPVRAFDKRYCLGGEPLVDGEFLHIDGLTPSIEVLATPGHTDDSVCFAVHTDGGDTDADVEGILTGDTIAGRHTTMISETTGDLGDYLETLRLLARRGSGVRLLPGHGPDRDDTAELAEKYLQRREHRLRQVTAALEKLGEDATVGQIVDEIYIDVDPVLRDSAKQSTRVALRHLGAL